MSLRKLFSLCALVALCAFFLTPQPAVSAAEGPTLMSGGPLTFGPDNVLFIADNTGAKIVALELGDRVSSGTSGTKDVPGIDQKIAALLGTDAREIQINDLAVSPTSKNAFISVSRGRGANATPVLLRVDGAGTIEALGAGIGADRVGERVWVYEAQWQRMNGTAAEYVSLPAHLAIPLPDAADFAGAACLGIPAMTAPLLEDMRERQRECIGDVERPRDLIHAEDHRAHLRPLARAFVHRMCALRHGRRALRSIGRTLR